MNSTQAILRDCLDEFETQRPSWSGKTLPLRLAVEKVVEELRSEWPLSVRQVYYKLVGANVIPNSVPSYKKITAIIAAARVDGFVHWDAIEDRTRGITRWQMWPNAACFLSEKAYGLTHGYARDTLQGQENAVECWVEKSALGPSVEKVCGELGVPVVVTRGYPSITVVEELARRAREAAAECRRTVVVLATDLDPSGANIGPSIRSSLKHDFGVTSVVFDRVMLTPEQVSAYDLIVSPDAIKMSDTRARKFVERHGRVSVELDALDHETFRGIIREGILRHLSQDKIRAEEAAEERERAWLEGQSRAIALAINAVRGEVGND
jgi:hypothetical protein